MIGRADAATATCARRHELLHIRLSLGASLRLAAPELFIGKCRSLAELRWPLKRSGHVARPDSLQVGVAPWRARRGVRRTTLSNRGLHENGDQQRC
jgi:hypothetical protein